MRLLKGNREERLVERLCEGDGAAMREFYSLYGDFLAKICARYVADGEDLKDVFQNALIRIFSRVKDFTWRGPGSLRAWAAKVTVNESLDFLRERKRHEFVRLARDLPDEPGMNGPEPEDPDIRDIPPEVFYRMIRQMPTGYRTVFNLYVFEEKSHEEIAALLGIGKDTSASQFHRAKKWLAKKIREYNETKEDPR